METHFCDPDCRRSQNIERSLKIKHGSIMPEDGSFAILRSYGNQSSAICDRNVSHNILNSDRLTVGKKSARNLIYLVSSWTFFESNTDVSFGFEADVVVALGVREEINLVAAKFPPRCPPCCLL